MRKNHFETLGVHENSSSHEIKIAFRARAMLLHPDKLRNASQQKIEKAHEDFVRLRAAYDILVNPELREKYIAERNAAQNVCNASSSASSYHEYRTSYTSSGATDFANYRNSSRNRYGYYNENNADTNSIANDRIGTGRSRISFEKAWRDAIHEAMHGPFSEDMISQLQSLPEELETEELKHFHDMKEDRVLLHIVCGRTSVGTVTYETEHLDSHNSCDNQTNSECLKLFFRDSLLSTCTRSSRPTSDPQGRQGEMDAVFEFESKVDFLGRSEDSLRSIGRAVLFPESFFRKSRDGLLFDENNEIIYQLKTFKQPGVDNFHFFHANEGYLEFLCTRAWLPTASLWLFPPRDPLFASGGWYLQQNKHGKFSRFRRRSESDGLVVPTVLDPSLAILLCAFKSLDRMKK
jgi:curved DNA-binding protein CbpA